ncbi:DUF4159 domain-containing protein [Jannaschia sp. LMIT008]|uniref:DUF4159 domain-containing protein n=1 Tax=Jannaschia maritima TaxID=3032585 RepID=UPI002810D87D|nr:DUF4159 domain-containing protein [Jannaschia sp. LMIT008]
MSGLAFTTPLLLLGLILLPILWWLLRAVPPAPIRRRFPGIVLLLGLRDDESQTATTPWWLLALRMLAVAAAIVGFAGPILNPRQAGEGQGPLLVVMDASWASARDWPQRIERVEGLLRDAARAGRTAAVLPLTDPLPDAIEWQGAEAWVERLPSIRPRPWAPDYAGLADLDVGGATIVWLSDGLDRPGRDALDATVIEGLRPVLGLTPATYEDGIVSLPALRSPAAGPVAVPVRALGPGPNGGIVELARAEAAFPDGAGEATVEFDLPSELRNRIARFEVDGTRSAGAVALADDSLARREVALLTVARGEGEDLLDPLFYLRRALAPSADVIEGDLDTILPANPDVLVLADVARLSPAEADRVEDWVAEGGLLLRFAGPRLAGSDAGRAAEDPLLPVRLRDGGRSVGGALSWGEPKTLRPFDEDSPFAGLPVPEDVTVTSHVVAQPDPTLATRAIAALADGTPLVTRKALGQGQVVLFHVTANAEWSNLPLSGLFVRMLERLAIATRPARPDADALDGTVWTPRVVLDGFGVERDAGDRAGVAGEVLADATPGPDLPPGLYDGPAQSLAVNVLAADDALAPAAYPPGTDVQPMALQEETDLTPYLLTLALLLVSADVLATLWLGGRLRGGAVAVLALALSVAQPPAAHAQEEPPAIPSEVALAYVVTGDARTDEVSLAGLRGLSEILTARTSVEPDPPRGVDLEADELAFFPMLYWPVVEDQPLPSADAYAKLNAYLRGGGMIVFDTRDADIGGFGSSSPASRRLRDIAAPLDIPPLEPLPADHVLTRSFYLLQDFPGRYASRDLWVEASPDVDVVEGMPFRNLNDGVTPVLIGANDWAAAWALDEGGQPLLPLGGGFAGERQREIAFRFGVNLVMHVLSGNYKSDQVHVPALLDRLGN